MADLYEPIIRPTEPDFGNILDINSFFPTNVISVFPVVFVVPVETLHATSLHATSLHIIDLMIY